jgi:hypothetical protein
MATFDSIVLDPRNEAELVIQAKASAFTLSGGLLNSSRNYPRAIGFECCNLLRRWCSSGQGSGASGGDG